MTAIFFVYDTVDREVVHASEEWPGSPRSAYRPLYWAGKMAWWIYTATPEGDRPMGKQIPEHEVPEVVRLAKLVAS
jgi:hypothetical protein